MKVLTFISIFIMFFSSSANAKNTFWMGDPPSKKIRQDQATEWLKCLKIVHDQIPTLSPAEKKWIETEVDNELAKGTYTRRASAAMDSKEYHFRLTKSHIGEIISTLTFIANSKSVEKNKEIINWALLAHQFMDSTFWSSISVLVERKLIDEKICDLNVFYFENFVLQAQAIISRVIVNNLNGTLP